MRRRRTAKTLPDADHVASSGPLDDVQDVACNGYETVKGHYQRLLAKDAHSA